MNKMKITIILLLIVTFTIQGVTAAGYHIPTVSEGLLNSNGCYIGAYLGGNQGVNNKTCVNYYAISNENNSPWETQVWNDPEHYGETDDKGVDGIDTGIETFRSGVEALKTGSGSKQLLFSRYYDLQWYPDNDYGKIKYVPSAPCYDWVEKVLQDGGVPVLIIYPWTLTKNNLLDLSVNNSNDDPKTGVQIMTEIAQKCDVLSNKYADSKGQNATILICFGLEYNTQWIVNPSSNDHVDNANKQAWRRMYRDAYTIVHNNANPSVQMVWAGNIAKTKEDRIYYWPGLDDNGNQLPQDYVDWVGMTWYPWNGGPLTLDDLSGFYDYYANKCNHPFIFMETSADGWGNTASEDLLKTNQVNYLYNEVHLKKYPLIKGIIWFNVIKGEPKSGADSTMVTKNFSFPDSMWNNYGQSTTIPGLFQSKTNNNFMMGSLYPEAVSDAYFLSGGTSFNDPKVDFTFTPPIANVSENVTFSETVSGSDLDILWDFDDGSTIECATNPVHKYQSPGRYNVTLTITNSYGKAKAVHTVPIRGLIPDFEISPAGGWAVVNSTVTFKDSSKGAPVVWFWDFDDGTKKTTTQNMTTHTYTKAGTYTINMTATNWQPKTASKLKRYTIVEKSVPKEVNFVLPEMKQSGKTPFTVDFKDITPVQSNVTAWFWDFGDGSNSVEESPSHTYNIPGQYTVILTVRNDMGTNEVRKVALIVVT